MAHPLLEALYIGLLASNMGAGGAAGADVAVATTECPPRCVAAASRRGERVVYDWASGSRMVHPAVLDAPARPMLGISADQALRLSDPAAG
jgi:hypothetical protein